MRKCTARPFLCLPELCAWGVERHAERRRGHHPDPKQILQGRHQVNTADVPMCLTGAARRQGQDPQTLLGLRLCPPGQEGLGQSDSQGASGHQGLWKATWEVCAPSDQGARAGRVPGHFLHSLHLCACVPGAQRACGAVPCVVPKVANLRNHQGAHTDANSQGFLYKLELGFKCTRHRGIGTWTPRLRGVAAL